MRPYLIMDEKNSENTNKTRTLIDTSNIISLASPMTVNFNDVNKDVIKDGFDIGIDFANTFYDSFLPHLDSKDRLDWISSIGYSLGYIGGGILFLINVLMFLTLYTGLIIK